MSTMRATSLRRCLQVVAEHLALGHAGQEWGAPQIALDAPCEGPQVTDLFQPSISSLVGDLVRRGCRRNPRGQVRLGLRQRQCPAGTTSWVVFVEDKGPGPSLEVFGVDPTGTSSPAWLTAAAERVEAMGGRLGAQTVRGPGQGTVIWFSLPDRVFARRLPNGLAEDRIRGSRVLVVDDNITNFRVLEGLLERWGCTVAFAPNGAEANRVLDKGGFDLVLMDIQMPVMDGYEATRSLRSRPGPSQGIPVVAVTADARPEDRARCLEAGMDDHVAKPVRPEVLVAAIDRAVRLSRQR